jgi:hypothetical protein
LFSGDRNAGLQATLWRRCHPNSYWQSHSAARYVMMQVARWNAVHLSSLSQTTRQAILGYHRLPVFAVGERPTKRQQTGGPVCALDWYQEFCITSWRSTRSWSATPPNAQLVHRSGLRSYTSNQPYSTPLAIESADALIKMLIGDHLVGIESPPHMGKQGRNC